MTAIFKSLIAAACLTAAATAHGQTITDIESVSSTTTVEAPDGSVTSVSDSLLAVYGIDDSDVFDRPMALPPVMFMPAVYDRYHFFTPLNVTEQVHSGDPAMRWLEDLDVLSRRMQSLKHDLFFNHPELVKYNLASLPEPPEPYVMVVDPSDFSVSVKIQEAAPTDITIVPEEVKKKHWIHNFNASLQFSQAFVSPNWYQGGNNAINALGMLFYHVKLNEAYHPNFLFETTAQYKLGINNAPDDEVHNYNISDDQFQINTTFGIKAAKRWYYSFTGQFKTQLLKSYKSNSYDLSSAFLSPGELTAGIGMTYAYANAPQTIIFNASIAPISYNLVTCINDEVDGSAWGIKPGHKTISKFGSTVELNFSWKIAHNILYKTRLFGFTDYSSFRADWENTVAFEINKFLTTQIYAHLRYDSQTPEQEDRHWKKLQVKEIFSIGFAYKFSSL
ncbi:MAG: DUF3078 domain-containing protein [Muribaculaceae bacterium]|nr:DUF3078 domain-containing protein [Muribaculaceae bacterium]